VLFFSSPTQFNKPNTIRLSCYIISLCALLALAGCSGSRQYFKAAERLEKQGLVNDAADYYLEALQRKPTNVEARIKLRDVGQKHISNLASDFFRDYNTQQTESALGSFEKLKDFYGKAAALDVQLDYPKTYNDDYQQAIETFCLKNYNQASALVSQKKYNEAVPYLSKVKRYNGTYKNTQQLDIIATCEPLYQSAVNSLENKNYSSALTTLNSIRSKTDHYKDLNDLLELANAQQTKSFILFAPKPSSNASEREIEDYMFTNFSQAALQKLSLVKIINNTPFQNAPGTTDFNSSTSLDFVQAIRKATGADYFYMFDVANRNQSGNGPSKSSFKGFQEQVTRRNDGAIIFNYSAFDYNVVKGQRIFSYDFKYKIINAYTNQIVSQQTQNISARDAVEFQEFQQKFTGDINSLFPYNPQQTPPTSQYNPSAWRRLFSARNTLKTFEELKTDAYNQNINLFTNSAGSMK